VRKSDNTARKASAAALPSDSAATGQHNLSLCLWYSPNLSSSALVVSRSVVERASPPRQRVGCTQRAGKCTRPPCRELAHAYTHAWWTVWPFQPLRPILHQTRSPERPRNGPYDRTVSTAGPCFGNLTPAGETVILMHPARQWACAVGVSALRSDSKIAVSHSWRYSNREALFFFSFGLESTQLARRVQPERAQVEVQ